MYTHACVRECAQAYINTILIVSIPLTIHKFIHTYIHT
jgi:hypothetical protein